MADLPILFSAPMVLAIIREIERPGTGKTQTRRVLRPQPENFETSPGVLCKASLHFDEGEPRGRIVLGNDGAGVITLQRVPYAVGDRLWVREAWRCEARFDQTKPSNLPHGVPIYYAADPDHRDSEPGCAEKLRPGMFMMRWASRLTLIVTDVRVQRVQEMEGQHPSESDAIAEGVNAIHHGDGAVYYSAFRDWPDGKNWIDPTDAFRELWDSLNAARGFSWDTNPWVAAYTFRPILSNIDNLKEAA